MKTKTFIQFAILGAFVLGCGIWIGRQTLGTGGKRIAESNPESREGENHVTLSRLSAAIDAALKQPKLSAARTLMNAASAVADEDIAGALALAERIVDPQLRARFRNTLLA